MDFYLTFKAFHIIAVISWMVGLLYLPRLYVYHVKAKSGGELDKTLKIMEHKLLKIIMNPAMILTFIFGFALLHQTGFAGGWVHAKLLLAFLLAGFHGFLAKCRRNFSEGKNQRSEKFYRIINEVPTILLIAIVFLAIFKPF